jgi:DNA primase
MYSYSEIEDNEIKHRFKPETFLYYESFFTRYYPSPLFTYRNKLAIPIKKNNVTIGLAMRDYTGVGRPKWMYHPKGISTSIFLYNYDNAMKVIEDTGVNELVLVEGIFDVWAYHEAGIDNVVCIFGSNLSEEQEKMILRAGVNVVLSFDNDDAGNKCTNKVIKKLKNKTEMKKVFLPSGSDPCDLERDILRNLYLKRKKI